MKHLEAPHWAEARRIVTSPSTILNPVRELWAVLRGRMPYLDFVKLFGNPARSKVTLRYSRVARSRHLATLDVISVGMLDLAGEQKALIQDEAAKQVLRIQNLMGSTYEVN